MVSGMLVRGEDDWLFKFFYWRVLGCRYYCDGDLLKCEKCRRVFEVSKVIERFEVKRVVK